MIEVKEIWFNYGKDDVLKGLNLELEEGKVHGIVGLNGAGKTTFLSCLSKQLIPQKGTISFNGKEIEKKNIGFLETQNYFYPRITGREYLELFSSANSKFNYEDWNKVFGLPLDRLIEGYSTGMKKKTAFMGILSLNRDILILDEPFNGLDLETNQTLKQIIELLRKQGKTILVTSHILEVLRSVCDQICYLNGGQIQKIYKEEEYGALESLLGEIKHEGLEGLIDRGL